MVQSGNAEALSRRHRVIGNALAPLATSLVSLDLSDNFINGMGFSQASVHHWYGGQNFSSHACRALHGEPSTHASLHLSIIENAGDETHTYPLISYKADVFQFSGLPPFFKFMTWVLRLPDSLSCVCSGLIRHLFVIRSAGILCVQSQGIDL